jgi:hypothetical protein
MGVAQHLHSSYGADAILCVDEQVVEMSTHVAAFAEVGETHANKIHLKLNFNTI